MIFGDLFPEMVGAAQALYMYIKSNEFTEEIYDKFCPIKHLSQDCAEELFRPWMELRSKDGEVTGFVCAHPEYDRCDRNAWHGTIDGKINATRLIMSSVGKTDRYSCGEKLMIMREGLQDFVEDSVVNSVTACNYEYTLEDTYYEAKYTFLTQNGYGSPSSLIADGFGNAGDILMNLSNVFQQEQRGAAATFGVFARRSLDVVNRNRSARQSSAPIEERTVTSSSVNINVQNTVQDRTFPPQRQEGNIIQTESFNDSGFIK